METQLRLLEQESSLELFKGADGPASSLSLADVGRTLARHRPSLSTLDLGLLHTHQHFCLTHDVLKTLENSYKATMVWNRFITYTFDTADFQLAQRNWWLILQEGVWTLEKCSLNEHSVIVHTELDAVKIKEEVASALGRSPSETLEQLCPNEWAVLRTERHTYHASDGWCLYADSVELADDDHYLVGTLGISTGSADPIVEQWPPVLSTLYVVSPARSRVAEYIHCHLPDLAKTLRDKGVLPQVPFCSGAAGLNHQGTEHLEDDEDEDEDSDASYDEDAARRLPLPPIILTPSESDDPAAAWRQYCKEHEEEEKLYFGH